MAFDRRWRRERREFKRGRAHWELDFVLAGEAWRLEYGRWASQEDVSEMKKWGQLSSRVRVALVLLQKASIGVIRPKRVKARSAGYLHGC